MECKWINGSVPDPGGSVKDCSLDAQNGTLRYKVLRMTKIMSNLLSLCTDSGESSQVNYHISLSGKKQIPLISCGLTAADGTVKEFKQKNSSYDLTINKQQGF